MPRAMIFPETARSRLGGVLGRAIEASRTAHLGKFITGEASPAIALFHPGCTAHNHEGDWYGEHAGKWLSAAARAVRTGGATDGGAELAASVRRVADFLVGVQATDGYLGTYAPERRFMCRRGPATPTWDGAPTVRTWDIWTHAYLILGLLEAAKALAEPRYLAAARRIGDLCWRTFSEGGISVVTLGNHHGLSATVLLDPAVELFFATGENKYLELAELILRQAGDAPALALLPQALAGTDAAFIATGKAYQLCWNLVGLAKLHHATGNPDYLGAVRQVWESIRAHHLTLGGGPWGGVGHRSREVFNAPGFFSPYGYVETCSTLAWIQLNRELLAITGEAKFAEEIEQSAYNDLLGAQAPGGDNWCYYSFPNGRRVFTTYWRCCKSSGPLALEELPGIACGLTADGGIAINLYGPGQFEIPTPFAGLVRIAQRTRYPFDGKIELALQLERAVRFPFHVRIPSWTSGATIAINGAELPSVATTSCYQVLEREWQPGDVVTLSLQMAPQQHRRTNRNVQESRAPDGAPVAQEVLRFDYAAITRGPLVYATGLIDGFKAEETIRMPTGADSEPLFSFGEIPAGHDGPVIRMNLGYRPPLEFLPYYEAGGRVDGAWRLTWLQLAPTPA